MGQPETFVDEDIDVNEECVMVDKMIHLKLTQLLRTAQGRNELGHEIVEYMQQEEAYLHAMAE
jgi:hypothetical protein